MPVEFLSDDEAAAYGRFGGPPSRAELERVFFLDDTYRRDIKGVRNLQEGRHSLAAAVFHRKKGGCTSATTRAWKTSSARSAWS